MASHGRASAIIGAGTLVSRLTGLLRSVVLVAVIGSTATRAGDAFIVANTLPTNIYELLAAGVITGIMVPQIVRAAQSHSDGGARFVSKLLTLGTIVMVAATAIVMALAPVLIGLYGAKFTPDQLALSIAFAYWCLPQLLFYGLYALIGEVLNARKVFGPYTWAPVVNNVVSLAGFGVFLLLFGGPLKDVAQWTPEMIALMGVTATGGIALQALLLLFFWKRTGLTFRPDFQWRGMGLRHMGRLAWWTFLAVLVGQLAALIQTRIVSAASGDDSSIAALNFAWLIFMLPHSVVAMSISTSYFTELSEDVAAGRSERVHANLDQSTRGLSVFAFGLMVAIAAASVPIARVFTDGPDASASFALVLLAYLVGLVPFGILVVVRRAFFAFHDTRTPFYFTVVQCALAIGGAFLAQAVLPLSLLAAGIAVTQSLSMFVQLPVALFLLRRHIGDARFGATWRALVRFAVAAVPAGLAGWGVFALTGGVAGWTTTGLITGLLGSVLVGGVSLVVYVAALALVRAPELAAATRAVRRIIGR
ncbi:MAG: murein biosynthesis integral membrane protein MurJ [Microbacterium sp. SCN 70-200]|uniref:murein biosynthesis integral membrane protein MurJ n=1 Tax=unclassified Microbacterium TaxID=2609290 RepID=UPI000869BA03|nr:MULTISPECIES: murein biosynthesis integral membrane protein MurJ [unclassified Microbacterium]MBN9216166.1 murein biosynthesis integral membrane protein MurJ [Microbacterium sp.]ODT39645.1 MAG: murein biosynthesis integral membrane protein MurJ [Microbacterium sp. SCN 70-200]OJV81431.1 MAG: murein biosynthesis integral membrane protein MurJ [Microbacterium sp. 70-16]